MSQFDQPIRLEDISVVSTDHLNAEHGQRRPFEVHDPSNEPGAESVLENPVGISRSGKAVSVIIPYTRPSTIGNAIESVLRQDFPIDQLEVIVVGRKSSSLLDRWPQIVAVDAGPIYRPGKARNLGAAQASGDVLLFLDDDCEAHSNWLEENLVELKKDVVGAVGGMVSSVSNSVIARSVDFSNFGMCQTRQRQERPICSATFGIRADVFNALGGFDEYLRVHEDIDLCHRLDIAGYKTIYQPKVRVLHNHSRTTLRSMLSYLYSGGRQGGLDVEDKYRELSGLYRLLLRFRHPLAYFLLLVPVSFAATVRTIALNVKEHRGILALSPLILVGKMSCHFGIWNQLLEKQLRSSWRRIGAMFNARRQLEYPLFKRWFRTPRELTLFVTSQCNAKCGHCFYWQHLNQPTDLSFEEVERLSASLGKLDKLLISGGEPFLRRDLPEICQLFFENNSLRFVSIPTNGLLPELIAAQARRILSVAQGRAVNISMSLDGFGDVHDELRGVPGNFNRVIATYKALSEVQTEYGNLSLRVNSVVMNATIDGIGQLIERLPELMPNINTPALTLLRGTPYDKNLLLPDPVRLRNLHKHKNDRVPGKQPKLWRFADWATFTMSMETIRQDTQAVPCEAGRILGVVEADGTVKHCEMLPPIGNLREGTFREIWDSQKARKAREDIVAKKCHCTHECNLFPSMLAHPLQSARVLARAQRENLED